MMSMIDSIKRTLISTKDLPLDRGKIMLGLGVSSALVLYGALKYITRKKDEENENEKKEATAGKKKRKQNTSSGDKKSTGKEKAGSNAANSATGGAPSKEVPRSTTQKIEELKKKKEKKAPEELKNSLRLESNKSGKFKEKDEYQEDYSENDGEFSTGMATDDHYRHMMSREEFKLKNRRNFSTDVEDFRFNKQEASNRKKKILKIAKQEKGHDKIFFQMLANLADGED